MNVLAIDTATEACSVALLLDGETFERYEVAGTEHSKLVLPMLDELMQSHGVSMDDIHTVAFDRGPGSFTGLRIGAGIAQGLALGANKQVVGVSSLAALAKAVIDDMGAENVACAIDARMGEVYWGCFAKNRKGIEPLLDECVIMPEQAVFPFEGACHGVGSGWDKYTDVLLPLAGSVQVSRTPNVFPRAKNVALLAAADFADADTKANTSSLPVYVRNKVADLPKQKL